MVHAKLGLKHLGIVWAMALMFIAGAVLPASAQKQDEAPSLDQIQLTEAHVKGYLKVGAKLSKLFDRIDKAGGEPDEKLQAELEAVAKEGGFKSFDELENVVSNIAFVMFGMSDDGGSFTEPVEVRKQDLKDAEADKELKGDEKEQMIASIKESIAQTPKLKYRGNVDVVKKHLKELEALFQ